MEGYGGMPPGSAGAHRGETTDRSSDYGDRNRKTQDLGLGTWNKDMGGTRDKGRGTQRTELNGF
jgi:hypothetical protein